MLTAKTFRCKYYSTYVSFSSWHYHFK